MSDFFARLAADVLMRPGPVFQSIRPQVPTLFAPGADVPPGEILPETPPLPTADTMATTPETAATVDLLPELRPLSRPPIPALAPLVPHGVSAERTIPPLQTLLAPRQTEAVNPSTAEPATETPDAAEEIARSSPDVPSRPTLEQPEDTPQTAAPSPTMPVPDPAPRRSEQPADLAVEQETAAPSASPVVAPPQPTMGQPVDTPQTATPSPATSVPSLQAQPDPGMVIVEGVSPADTPYSPTTTPARTQPRHAPAPVTPETPAPEQSATLPKEDALPSPIPEQPAVAEPDPSADHTSSQTPPAAAPHVSQRETAMLVPTSGAAQHENGPKKPISGSLAAGGSASIAPADRSGIAPGRAPVARRALPPEPSAPGEPHDERRPPPAAADQTAEAPAQPLSPHHPAPEPVASPAPARRATRGTAPSMQPVEQPETDTASLKAQDAAQTALPADARNERTEVVAQPPLAPAPPGAIRPMLTQTANSEPEAGPVPVERHPQAAPPTVTINIGRVVVRSGSPPPTPTPASPPPGRRQPAITLQDYLARHGRSR